MQKQPSVCQPAPIRRSVSGVLEASDLAYVAGGAHGPSKQLQQERVHSLLTSTLLELDAQQGYSDDEPLSTFPATPFYGLLKKVTLEIPILLSCSNSSATHPILQRLNDTSAMTKVRALQEKLQRWSREGGGASYRYGCRFPVAHHVQTKEVAGVTVSGRGATLKGMSMPAPSAASSQLVGSPVTCYEEYIESFSDSLHTFFTAPRNNPGAAATSCLYFELHKHHRFRDVASLFFWEGQSCCCFVQCSHVSTQRYIASLCDDVGLTLDWIHGATLVTTTGCAWLNKDLNSVSLTCGPRKRKRRATDDDFNGVKVLADVLVNLEVMRQSQGQNIQTGDGTVNANANSNPVGMDGGIRLKTVVPTPLYVTLLASFPFLHAEWQCALLRQTDTSICNVPLSAAQETIDSGGEHISFAKLMFSAPESRCTSPLLPMALQSLIALLVDDAGLHHFALTMTPWCVDVGPSPVEGDRVDTVATAGLSVAGKSSSATATPKGLIGYRRADVMRRILLPTEGTLRTSVGATLTSIQNGICYSRLSSNAWLTQEERVLITKRLESEKDEDDFLAAGEGQSGHVSSTDVEAEFFPCRLEFHRESFTVGGSADDTRAWGKSFIVRNVVMRVFEEDSDGDEQVDEK